MPDQKITSQNFTEFFLQKTEKQRGDGKKLGALGGITNFSDVENFKKCYSNWFGLKNGNYHAHNYVIFKEISHINKINCFLKTLFGKTLEYLFFRIIFFFVVAHIFEICHMQKLI